MVQIGSWGLPEFGLTEAAARLLSGGKTTDLSQAVTGGGNKAAPPPPPPPGPQSKLIPGSSQTDPRYVNYNPQPTPTQPTPGGGGGGGGGARPEYDKVKAEMLSGQRKWDDNLLAQIEAQYKSVPSAENAAARAAEQRMRRYGELVKPVEQDIESYLSNRRPITELFNEQMAAQGIPAKQESLTAFEKDEAKLRGDLATLPQEDIERRKETGMLTAAAERRIRAMEERPIRDQLLGVSSAKEMERVGLQRAFDLVDKYLDVIREQEQRDLQPIQTKLESARGEFENEVDALAARLTGFNEDRKVALKAAEDKVAAGIALTQQERKDAVDLQKLELEHLYKMEQIAAQNAGQKAREFEVVAQIAEQAVKTVQSGSELRETMGAYVGKLTPDQILTIYNTHSKYGPAKETPEDLQSIYGVSGSRFPSTTTGSPV